VNNASVGKPPYGQRLSRNPEMRGPRGQPTKLVRSVRWNNLAALGGQRGQSSEGAPPPAIIDCSANPPPEMLGLSRPTQLSSNKCWPRPTWQKSTVGSPGSASTRGPDGRPCALSDQTGPRAAACAADEELPRSEGRDERSWDHVSLRFRDVPSITGRLLSPFWKEKPPGKAPALLKIGKYAHLPIAPPACGFRFRELNFRPQFRDDCGMSPTPSSARGTLRSTADRGEHPGWFPSANGRSLPALDRAKARPEHRCTGLDQENALSDRFPRAERGNAPTRFTRRRPTSLAPAWLGAGSPAPDPDAMAAGTLRPAFPSRRLTIIAYSRRFAGPDRAKARPQSSPRLGPGKMVRGKNVPGAAKAAPTNPYVARILWRPTCPRGPHTFIRSFPAQSAGLIRLRPRLSRRVKIAELFQLAVCDRFHGRTPLSIPQIPNVFAVAPRPVFHEPRDAPEEQQTASQRMPWTPVLRQKTDDGASTEIEGHRTKHHCSIRPPPLHAQTRRDAEDGAGGTGP